MPSNFSLGMLLWTALTETTSVEASLYAQAPVMFMEAWWALGTTEQNNRAAATRLG